LDDIRDAHECPRCGSVDVPKLIVRGSENTKGGLSLQCRVCGCEWSDEATDRLQAS